MNILILGSEGFIGKNLVSHFVNLNYYISGCDLYETASQSGYTYKKISRLSPELDELFKNNNFDICINAAGSGNVPFSVEHPFIDFEANSLDVIKILDAIRIYQPLCKYVHFSSAAVYGNPEILPVRENALTSPVSPYGWHKLISEQLCREFTSIYNIPTVILRPFSVYGTGLKKQLFWDLYQKYKHIKEEKYIKLWGTGRESRDFINVKDVAKAVELIISKSNFIADIFNVANGEEIEIRKAASYFLTAIDEKIEISFSQQGRAGDPVNWQADIQKLKDIGFKPEVDLQQGLKDVAIWLKKNHSI